MTDLPRGLTYTPEAPHSWAADFVLTELKRDAPPGARERLERHAREMDVELRKRESKATQTLRAAGFEFRVEPNTTQGQGGYFSPPLWLIQYFATANRPGRVLAGLIPGSFPLPMGIGSISLPIISTGSVVQQDPGPGAVVDEDIADSSGTSSIVVLAGQADCAVQLLEQSPPSAAADWAFFLDMAEAYDLQVEQQLIFGSGTNGNIAGCVNASNIQTVTYTAGSPTGSGIWPNIGKLFASVGDARLLAPEVWLMRTARLAWLLAAEDSQNRPFGLPSPVLPRQ